MLLETLPRTRASQSAQPIPEDWTTAACVYAWAEKQGLTKDWVDAQLDEFVIYWSDAGERRKSWDATFINCLKRLNAHPTTHSHRSSSDERSNTPDWLIKTMPAVQRLQSRFPGCERLLTREELAERGREEVRQLLARRREAAQRRLEVAIGRSGIPPRFQGKSFTGYLAALPGQQHALSVCRSYSKRFLEDGQRSDNLLLLGGPGTGKTHLATAILAEVIRSGYKGLFLSAADALQLMRDAYAPSAKRSERETMTVLTDPDLLVLDEVGMVDRVSADNPVPSSVCCTDAELSRLWSESGSCDKRRARVSPWRILT